MTRTRAAPFSPVALLVAVLGAVAALLPHGAAQGCPGGPSEGQTFSVPWGLGATPPQETVRYNTFDKIQFAANDNGDEVWQMADVYKWAACDFTGATWVAGPTTGFTVQLWSPGTYYYASWRSVQANGASDHFGDGSVTSACREGVKVGFYVFCPDPTIPNGADGDGEPAAAAAWASMVEAVAGNSTVAVTSSGGTPPDGAGVSAQPAGPASNQTTAPDPPAPASSSPKGALRMVAGFPTPRLTSGALATMAVVLTGLLFLAA